MFDLIAPFYDRLLGSMEDLKPIEDYLKGPIILDLGGGTGRVSQHIEDSFMRIILDESMNMLRQAKKKGLYAVRGYAESLPFPGESMDTILIVDSFHHFKDHKQVLRECYRVLKKGGTVIIREPDIDKFPIKVVALLERMALMRSKFYSYRDIIDMAEGFGAEVERGSTFFNLILKKI